MYIHHLNSPPDKSGKYTMIEVIQTKNMVSTHPWYLQESVKPVYLYQLQKEYPIFEKNPSQNTVLFVSSLHFQTVTCKRKLDHWPMLGQHKVGHMELNTVGSVSTVRTAL